MTTEQRTALTAALKLINDHADELAGFEHPDEINRVVDLCHDALEIHLGPLDSDVPVCCERAMKRGDAKWHCFSCGNEIAAMGEVIQNENK